MLVLLIVFMCGSVLSCTKEINYEDRSTGLIEKLDRTEWYASKGQRGQVHISFSENKITMKTGKVLGLHSNAPIIGYETFDFAIVELYTKGKPIMMGLKLMNSEELRIQIWQDTAQQFSYEETEELVINQGNTFMRSKPLLFF